MRRRRVCVVVTARPSYARIRSALRAIAAHDGLELQLLVAASALLSRYGDTLDVMRADGFEPAARVYMVVEGETPLTSAKTTGLGMVELATQFDNLQPDVVVTIADRYETLATAAAASYMNLPVAHVQGGEVTGSIDEKVRHAVTKLSNLHFVSTELSRERVIRMGEEPDTVHVTGCPSIDLAADVARAGAEGFDPFARYGGVGPAFDRAGGYLVVLQHPVTTEHEEARAQVEQTLAAVHASGLPAFWFWPNVDAGSDGTSKGIRIFRERHPECRIHFYRNMAPDDFVRLALGSRCVVGNSSFGIRESALLGLPVVNIGSRQQGRERGPNVLDVSHRSEAIAAAIARQSAAGRYLSDPLYGSGDAGARIAALLAEAPLRVEKRLAY